MKTLLCTTIAFLPFIAGSQLNVGIGTTTPAISAQLDISASNRGLLIPRVVLTSLFQGDPVGSPAEGLMVWNMNENLGGGKGFYFWQGSRWQKLVNSSESWNIVGNSSVDTGINFLGTTQNFPLLFRVSNNKSGGVYPVGGNTFLGYRAGQFTLFNSQNLSGENNTFFGSNAGSLNESGRANTFIGSRAGQLSNASFGNTAVGFLAGATLNTGQFNTVAGSGAGGGITTGSKNVVVGSNTGTSMQHASGNVYIGEDVAGFNTGGDFNTYVGHSAGFGNFGLTPKAESFNNVYVGDSSGYFTNGGRNNAFVGKRTGFNNQTGSYNVFMGDSSGYNNIFGNNNTFVGSKARSSLTLMNNATAIGANAFVTAANSMVLGGITGQNGATEMTNVGIGLTNPSRRFWVRFDQGTTGVTPNGSSIQVLERTGGHAYASFIGDTNRELGYLFGTSNNSADAGIVYNTSTNLRGMEFRTGGNSTKMTIASDGNVGIGTGTPEYRLHVVTNDAQNFGYRQGIVVENTASGVGNTGEAAISFKNAGDAGTGIHQWMVGLNQTRNLSFAYGVEFVGGSVTKMLIDSTGNLGIGTIAPSEKLEVNGNQKLNGRLSRPATGSVDMIPICYGIVTPGGSVSNGTGNFSAAQAATGQYEITITGETHFNSSYVTMVTPLSSFARMSSVASTAGKLLVRIFDNNGVQQDTSFYFVVYKP